MRDTFIACAVAECCGNAHYKARGGKGYCRAHLRRFERHGDATAGRTMVGQAMAFVENVALKSESDDCLIWPYNTASTGYGKITIDGRTIHAHRYVCERAYGKPPSDRHEAAHLCGKGHLGCVSRNHVAWKTKNENELDKRVHGTTRPSKLSSSQVRYIIRAEGTKTRKELAAQFHISTRHVLSIQNGEGVFVKKALSEPCISTV